MRKSLTAGLPAALALALTVATWSAAAAQQPAPPAEPRALSGTSAGDAWYYRPAPERDHEPTVAQQKAMARGAQRMARLEALRWYGFSNSRPTASAMAWTTMYSPAWQTPGGRPFAWHVSQRPTVIVTPAPNDYR
ncbi:MAG TPA: hypothetical protein VEQ85_01680 [Lacipirellulaceae bacterium]|nr:hypothetical protein [Lacipirellulaceae bacterium]